MKKVAFRKPYVMGRMVRRTKAGVVKVSFVREERMVLPCGLVERLLRVEIQRVVE